ncbi:uncharacterized protein LOC144422242 isoform X2 [Styela clava]
MILVCREDISFLNIFQVIPISNLLNSARITPRLLLTNRNDKFVFGSCYNSKFCKPLGCWNFENFTVTEDEITAAVWESSIGRINSHRLRLVRGSQFYRALEYNVPTFQSLYDDFEKQNRKVETQQDEETQKYLDAEWTFLTDYENYFIIVLNFESDWGAFVKASSPQITVEQLQMISNVLVANELPVSTMVLKNECVREQDLSRNPTTIVLMD